MLHNVGTYVVPRLLRSSEMACNLYLNATMKNYFKHFLLKFAYNEPNMLRKKGILYFFYRSL